MSVNTARKSAYATQLPDDPQFIDVNGVRLAVFERPGADPPIIFAHATGFHGRCWNQIINRIPERRSIAVYMRGHGLSSKPEPPYEWHTFGEDVATLTRALHLSGATGVGHSMGGHSLTLAASIAPEAFAELILIDPVIMPPTAYIGRRHEPHFARKRRNEWASPDEMFDRFKDRPPFSSWDQAVLRDYCDYGLAPAASGYVLACPPEIEASIYEASGLDDANLYGILGEIDLPVMVIRSATPMQRDGATMDMAASPTAPDLARHFRHGKDIQTPFSHFIPMESPAVVANIVKTAPSRSRLG